MEKKIVCVSEALLLAIHHSSLGPAEKLAEI